ALLGLGALEGVEPLLDGVEERLDLLRGGALDEGLDRGIGGRGERLEGGLLLLLGGRHRGTGLLSGRRTDGRRNEDPGTLGENSLCVQAPVRPCLATWPSGDGRAAGVRAARRGVRCPPP